MALVFLDREMRDLAVHPRRVFDLAHEVKRALNDVVDNLSATDAFSTTLERCTNDDAGSADRAALTELVGPVNCLRIRTGALQETSLEETG